MMVSAWRPDRRSRTVVSVSGSVAISRQGPPGAYRTMSAVCVLFFVTIWDVSTSPNLVIRNSLKTTTPWQWGLLGDSRFRLYVTILFEPISTDKDLEEVAAT